MDREFNPRFMPSIAAAFRVLSGQTMPARLQAELSRRYECGQFPERQIRFYADAMAGVHAHTDPVIHRRTLIVNQEPSNLLGIMRRDNSISASKLFDAMEIARSTALLAERYPGLRENILSMVRADAKQAEGTSMAVPLSLLAEIVEGQFGQPPASGLLKAGEREALEQTISDQAAYASVAIGLAKTLAADHKAISSSKPDGNPLVAWQKTRYSFGRHAGPFQ